MHKEDVAVAASLVAATGLVTEDGYAEEAVETDAEALSDATEEPPPFRLTSLPRGVLWHIARKMGPRSRAVCRALLDAYGPLNCSNLVLSGRYALSMLQRKLAGGGQHLQRVKSLQLLNLPWGKECEADLLATIVAKLPNLEDLTLPMGAPLLPLLAPLRGTLTALDIGLKARPLGAGAEALSTLSNLRSLAVSATTRGPSSEVDWQHLLGSFPQLARLSWDGAWTPQWLAGVRASVPQLTSLSLGQAPEAQHVWDTHAAAAVQQALAGLRSLSWDAASFYDPTAVNATLEALARCTWLDSVHLALLVMGCNPPPSLLQLSSLRLASLDVTVEFVGEEQVTGALHALSHLTKLRLSYNNCLQGAPRLPRSLVTLHLAGNWKPARMLPALQALPSLRVLCLHHGSHVRSVRWTPAAAEQLSKLTQLHSLSIVARSPKLLVPHLSGLTALRALRLDGAHRSKHDVTDGDLMHLAPLQELTSLVLGKLQRVCAASLLPLVEALPNLQQLTLADMLGSGKEGAALVDGLLPNLLPCLR